MHFILAMIMNMFFIGIMGNAYGSSVDEIDKWCKHYQYKNCALVQALVKTESSYNPNAFVDEKSGSYGLMMIQCDTAKDPRLESPLKFGCDQLFNPQINIRYGVMYLKMLEEKLVIFHIKDLIAAYNAGFESKNRAALILDCKVVVQFAAKDEASKEQLNKCNDIKWSPRRCKNYNKFNYKGFPPQECYPGEYINEEYVWKVYRRYKHLSNTQRP
jgi:hypothetical protein